MSKTQLKKLVIEKFRALNNVEIEFGDHITLICGKNGTSKSSILGIAAQIFSFESVYADKKENDKNLSFQKISGGSFKSQYSEHFRISDKFDTPGSMKVNIELHDGYTNQSATGILELMKRYSSPRPVIRNNSTAKDRNESRNFTHPVIFLSLKRLYPIADRKYDIHNFDYLNQHKQEFISLANELLNRASSYVTGTNGTISSAVAHGANYDQDSVSAGEDNAGQIILALMSFRKLKEEYPDYKGGLLLIDEADAGLFPTAQVNLLKIFDRECNKLDLQVVMTSHSPVLIEYAFEQSQQFRRKYKTVYLSNTYGNVQVMQDWSWAQIYADINTQTIAATSKTSLPKINIYFEDKEAADFFAELMYRQPLKKFTNSLSEITLGCSNYLQLVHKKIPEFYRNSIICLDADAAQRVEGKDFKTVLLLPGNLPPDQLIFETLYNLPADHEFWKNNLQFTRDVFTKIAREIISDLAINGDVVDVKKCILKHLQKEKEEKEDKKKAREMFKRFYKSSEFQMALRETNPWRHWVKANSVAANEFLEKFRMTIHDVMKNGYAVDTVKLTVLKVRKV